MTNCDINSYGVTDINNIRIEKIGPKHIKECRSSSFIMIKLNRKFDLLNLR